MVRLQPDTPRKEMRNQLFWFASWVAVTGIAAFLTPSPDGHGTHTQLGLPACASVYLFDRPCFGCGMTTAFTATVHGDLVTAWHAHPFGTLFYLIFTASAVYGFVMWLRKVRVDTGTKVLNRSLAILTAIFAAFGIVRFILVDYDSPYYNPMARNKPSVVGEEGRQSARMPEDDAAADLALSR